MSDNGKSMEEVIKEFNKSVNREGVRTVLTLLAIWLIQILICLTVYLVFGR